MITPISLFKTVHAWNHSSLSGYFEVYLKDQMDKLRRPDSRGLSQRLASREKTHVAGLGLSIDEPEAGNLIVEFLPSRTVAALVDEMIEVSAQGK